MRNREAEHGKQPAVGDARHEPKTAVDEDKLIGETDLRERRGLGADAVSPSHDTCCARECTAIGPQHDIRIEHGDQPLEVTITDGSKERLDHVPLLMQIGV